MPFRNTTPAEIQAQRAARKAANLSALCTPSRAITPGVYGARRAEEAGAVAKENAVRSEAYRRLVAAMPCIACGIHGYSQAAHPPPTGKGIKESDLECFPLCCVHPAPVSGQLVDGCHTEFDRMQMMPREQMREQAAVWGAQTRKAIRIAGDWPEGLDQLKETTCE